MEARGNKKPVNHYSNGSSHDPESVTCTKVSPIEEDRIF